MASGSGASDGRWVRLLTREREEFRGPGRQREAEDGRRMD